MAWNGNNDNWKWQLRDSKGRWIEMGRGVKWYSPTLKREVSGTVVGQQGKNAVVNLTSEPNDPNTGKPQQVSVKGSDIEVVQSKATLGAPAKGAAPKANTPSPNERTEETTERAAAPEKAEVPETPKNAPEAAEPASKASEAPALAKIAIGSDNVKRRMREAVEKAGGEDAAGIRITQAWDEPYEILDFDKASATLKSVQTDVDRVMGDTATKGSKVALNRVARELRSGMTRLNEAREANGGQGGTKAELPEAKAPEAPEAGTPSPTPKPKPATDEVAGAVDNADPLEAAGVERTEPYTLPGEKFPPTRQQQDIIDAVMAGKNTAVQALAGSGKTTTLEALAKRIQAKFPDKKIAYIAFNKSVQLEAEGRMPDNVESKTQHALAYGWADKWMKDRTNDRNSLRRGDDVAGFLGLRNTIRPKDGGEPMSVKEQAMAAVRTVDTFALSAEDVPDASHMPEKIKAMGPEVEAAVLDAATKIWADLQKPDGKMRYSLDHMRKQWALTKPDLSKAGSGLKRKADIIFMDEAQDTPKVMAHLMDQQTAQIVVVGDSNQNIYSSFTGSIDYMSQVDKDVELPLTKSWRFGPEVADIGNRFLQLAEAPNRVEGSGAPSEIVEGMQDPDAILVRSNAGMLGEILGELEKGRKVGVPAGTKKDLQSLVASAAFLKGQGDAPPKMHDDLAAYRSWDEVVAEAEAGNPTMTKIANMVNTHGIGGLRSILNEIVEKGGDGLEGFVLRRTSDPNVAHADGVTFGNNNNDYLKQAGFKFGEIPGAEPMKSGKNKGKARKGWITTGSREEQEAMFQRARDLASGEAVDVTISTAHKSKGLEWDRVKIGDDFKGPKVNEETGETDMPSAEEMRLAYVASTRAKKALDLGSLGYVMDYTDPNGGIPKPADTKEDDSAKEDEQPLPGTPDDPEAPSDNDEDEGAPAPVGEAEAPAPVTDPEGEAPAPEPEPVGTPEGDEGTPEPAPAGDPEAPAPAPDGDTEAPEPQPEPVGAPEGDTDAPEPAPAGGTDTGGDLDESPEGEAPVADEDPIPAEDQLPEPDDDEVVDPASPLPDPDELPTGDPEEPAPAPEPEPTPEGGEGDAEAPAPAPDEEPEPEPAPAPTPTPEPEPAPAPAPEPVGGPEPAPAPEGGGTPPAPPEEGTGGGTPLPDARPIHPVKLKAASYPDGTVIRSARTGDAIEKTDGQWHLQGYPDTPADPMDMDNPFVYDMPKQDDDSFGTFDGIDSVGPGDIIITRKGTQAAVVGKRDGKLVVAPHNQSDEQRRLRPALVAIDPVTVKGVNKFEPAPSAAAPSGKPGVGGTTRAGTPRQRAVRGSEVKDSSGNAVKVGDEVRTDKGTGKVVNVRPSDGPSGSVMVEFPDGSLKSFRGNKIRNTAFAETAGGDDPSKMEIGSMGEAADGRAFMVGKGNKPIFKGDNVALADGTTGKISGFAKGVQSVNIRVEGRATDLRKKASVVDAVDYTAPEASAPEGGNGTASDGEAPVGSYDPTSPEGQSFANDIADSGASIYDLQGALGEHIAILPKVDGLDVIQQVLGGHVTPKQRHKAIKSMQAIIISKKISLDYMPNPPAGAKEKLEALDTALWLQEAQTKRKWHAGLDKVRTKQDAKPLSPEQLSAYDGSADFSSFNYAESKFNPTSARGLKANDPEDTIGDTLLRPGVRVADKNGNVLGVVLYEDSAGSDGTQVRVLEATPNIVKSRGSQSGLYPLEDLTIINPEWDTSTDLDFNDDATSGQMVSRLEKTYPGVAFGFNGLDTESARAYAQTISKMFNKYPMLQQAITSVSSGKNDEGDNTRATGENNWYAYASFPGGSIDTTQGASRMVYNSGGPNSGGYLGTIGSVKSDIKSGFHHPAPSGREIESIVTHEFGHVLDFMTGKIDENDMYEVFKTVWGSDGENNENLGAYLKNQGHISGYSQIDGKINMLELTAEAFEDVEVNGANATPFSKQIHAELIRRLAEPDALAPQAAVAAPTA